MKTSLKMVVTISYAFMIFMNTLANVLPINGITTGQISDRYGNLFAPAGLTFSIWAIIYLALGVYVASVWMNQTGSENKQVGLYFSISSVLNGLWILAWHYELMLLSLFLMLGILLSLIYIALSIQIEQTQLRIYFHIYFAWITVATIANVTTLLVSLNFQFLMSDVFWTFLVLWVGVVITLLTANRFKSVTYLLVIIWAYAGILIKHLTEFNQDYPLLIVTLWGTLAVFSSMVVYLIYPKVKANIQSMQHK